MSNRELRRVQEKSRAAAQKQRAAAQKKKAADRKRGERKGIIKTIRQFLREVRAEMKKVIWPSSKEVTNYTMVVLVTVAVVSAFLLTLDYALKHLFHLITTGLF